MWNVATHFDADTIACICQTVPLKNALPNQSDGYAWNLGLDANVLYSTSYVFSLGRTSLLWIAERNRFAHIAVRRFAF